MPGNAKLSWNYQGSVQEAKFLFALRCRMLEQKGNYSGKHKEIICPCCKLEDDHQQHLLICKKLNTGGTLVGQLPEYDQLFGNNLLKQIEISRIMRQKYNLRKSFLNEKWKFLQQTNRIKRKLSLHKVTQVIQCKYLWSAVVLLYYWLGNILLLLLWRFSLYE